MNTTQFMDKQIMDLTSSQQSLAGSSPPNQTTKDFIDLINLPQDDDQHTTTHYDAAAANGIKREEMLPSYDFQPIRPISSHLDATSTASPIANAVPLARAWNSADSKSISRNYGSLESIEAAKVMGEKDKEWNVGFDAAAILAEIDRTMKKHADNLLHVLDGVSARLTQLESRTRHLEGSVDDLKVSVGNNYGSTDGKMRQLENILREVQTGVEVLKDKQEIVDAQLQLAKLQLSKADQQQPETQNTGHMDAVLQAGSAPPQSHQQLPLVSFPQPIPPVTVAPPSITQQNLLPAAPVPNQFPPNQIPSVPKQDPYYPPPGQTEEPPNPQYQVPSPQQPQPSPAAPPHQPYQPTPQPQFPPPPQPHQPQPPLGNHPEETSYPQSYPPSVRQPYSQPPSGAPSPPYYGTPSPMYEPQSSRTSSGFSAVYGPPPGPTEPYPYGGSPSQYGSNPTMKMQQLSSPTMSQSGGSVYPQLPTARILPQVLPSASGIVGGSGSSATGNRVPLDDVVDKVTNMGFPREQVRATVRKLTENGQSVDLNIVLDKLMNDDCQPQRGWFGR